jgi:hypothetical protein
MGVRVGLSDGWDDADPVATGDGVDGATVDVAPGLSTVAGDVVGLAVGVAADEHALARATTRRRAPMWSSAKTGLIIRMRVFPRL